MNLKEDDLRNRVAGGAENVSVIRRFTLNLVRLQSKKYSFGAEANPYWVEKRSKLAVAMTLLVITRR
ncbi:hypothetical protein NB464_04995 [Vibrio diabolicus]|nr:hypothetical protein [Vibrio diabolicus]MCR9424958.1 hypothetical protein [Vibrio diabolicus]